MAALALALGVLVVVAAFLLGVALVLLFLVLLAPVAALVAGRFLSDAVLLGVLEAVPALALAACSLASFFSLRFSAHSLARRSSSAFFSARLFCASSFFLAADLPKLVEDGVFLATGVALGEGVALALALGLRAGVLVAVGFFDADFFTADSEILTFLAVVRLAGVLLRLRLRPRLALALAPCWPPVDLRPRPREGVLAAEGLLRLGDSPRPPDLSRERVRPATLVRRVPTIVLFAFCL